MITLTDQQSASLDAIGAALYALNVNDVTVDGAQWAAEWPSERPYSLVWNAALEALVTLVGADVAQTVMNLYIESGEPISWCFHEIQKRLTDAKSENGNVAKRVTE